MPAGEVKAGEAFIELRASMRKLRGDMARARGVVKRTSAQIGAVARKAALIGGAMAAPLALGAKAASDFETQMAELQKVSDAETMAEMRGEIREMARAMPMAHEELSTLAADAARFGIEGTKNLRNFTRTAGMMGTATDLAADHAGEALAKLAEITDTPISQMENVGSAVNELSNNFATSSSEIVEASLRSSAALSQLGLSQTQIFGLTASLNAVSASARRAGTRLRRVGQQLMNPKKVEDFAEALGMDVAEFKAMREEAPIDIILTMAKSLKEGNKTGEKLRGTLNSVSRQALAGLGQNFDSVQEALGMSNKAFEEATSLQREYDIQSRTTSARVQVLKNNVVDLGIAFGKPLLDPLKDVINSITVVVQSLGKFIKQNKEIPFIVAGIAGGFLTLAAAGFIVQGALYGLSSAMFALMIPFNVVLGVVSALPAMFAALGSPIGVATAALAGLTAGLLTFLEAGDYIRQMFGKVWESLAEGAKKTFEGIKNALAGGDFKLAARVAITGLRTVWAKGVSKLKQLWTNMVTTIKQSFFTGIKAIKMGFENLLNTIVSYVNQVKKLWNETKANIQEASDKAAIAETYKQGGFGVVGSEAAIKKYNKELKKATGQADKVKKKWESIRKAEKKQHNQRMKEIDDEWDKDMARLEDKRSAQISQAKAAADKARAAWEEALEKARKKGEGKSIKEGIKKGLKDAGIDIDKILKGDTGITATMGAQTAGTFSAARLAGRFGGGEPIQKRQLEYMKQTAENTSKSARESEKQKTTYGA